MDFVYTHSDGRVCERQLYRTDWHIVQLSPMDEDQDLARSGDICNLEHPRVYVAPADVVDQPLLGQTDKVFDTVTDIGTKQQTDIVDEVIDGRRAVYGEPTNTFPRIAAVWQAILDGHQVQAWHVPLLQIGLKLIRTEQCPDYSDNSDDIEGFLAIFRELMGEDMIKARLVSEYLEIKEQRS